MPAFPKPSRADRLRTKQADQTKAKRALSALYLDVYIRDGYRCRACQKSVSLGGLNELTRAHPHHIVFRSQDKTRVADKTNICTLCPICHCDVTERRLWISGNADGKLRIRRTK